jgi:hypothetical protein
VFNPSIPIRTFSCESMYYEGRYENKASPPPLPLNVAPRRVNFLTHWIANTVQICEDHRCSNQSRAFNALLADVVDVGTRQRVVTEFLTTEDSSPIEIHRRLRSVCGEDAIDVSSERGKGDW